MRLENRRSLSAGVVLLLLAVNLAYAQTGAGSIQGTVKDTTGAVVPSARVVVTYTPTVREYSTATNEVGFFLFPSVQVGPYQITATVPGMETWKGELTLRAGQTAELSIDLKVASTVTEVTVAGDVTPLITTNSPTLATVVERARIEQLPLNGRIITNLVLMTTPGLVGEPGFAGRLYGLRYATEMLQDGAVLENREWKTIPDRPPGLDTIGEFRVETNNSSAKMNRPGSIMLSTRAGTNEIHGSIFNTARNSGLGVARARQDYYLKPPHLVRNEFGASLGGPIFLPKLYNGRNKTFFFFAYEAYRMRSATTRSINVPTIAMREGDFSGLVNAAGRRYTLYDPLTTDLQTWRRQPFPDNRIPLGRESPLAKYLNSITPLPILPDNPLVSANWFGTGFNNGNQHTETLRVDHRLTDKDQIFFRYTHSPSGVEATSSPYGGSPTTLDKKANARITEAQNDTGVANWNHSFSPTLFGETLVTVARDYRGGLPYTGMEEIATKLGLPNPFDGVGFPRIPYTMSTTPSSNMSFDSSVNPYLNYAWIYQFDQNFTNVKGRHELHFGARLRFAPSDTLEDQQEQQGAVSFSGSRATELYDPASGTSYSSVPFSGHVAGNFFLGMGTYSARFNRSWLRMSETEQSGYFQDNFKVISQLTLNFGVRYEYFMIRERNNALIGFNEKNKAIVLGRSLNELARLGAAVPAMADAYGALGVKYQTPGEAGLPDNLIYPNRWDFGPRVGFAWRLGALRQPTVVRGGYAIFGYPERMRSFQGVIYNTIPGRATISNNPNQAEQSPDGLPNYWLRSVPTIVAGVNSTNALSAGMISAVRRGEGIMYFMDPHQPTARAHQWNLTVERELFSNTSLKFGYVGTHGTRMAQFYDFNEAPGAYVWYATTGQPLPTGEYANVATRPYDREVFGRIRRFQKTGWSNNSSFQVEVEHRYSKGYAFQAFYVMSNAMRAAGSGWSDDALRTPNVFLPGLVPTDDAARNRFLFYRRDTDVPKHQFNWNFLVDLPVGRGKPLARSANLLLDGLIGGWQVAGSGVLRSRYFQLSTSNWGAVHPVEVYGKKYPIQDCRSGVCHDGWLYWNGYIPANRINSYDRNGRPNGVMGVPDSYRSFQEPIIPFPKDGGSASDPLFPYYGSNTVWVPMKNGTLQRTSYAPGIHPLQNQFVLGPMIWSMDASLFKSVKLTEQAFLRINADFFNVFNMPGMNMPGGGDGLLINRNSVNSPRLLQLTLRLSW